MIDNYDSFTFNVVQYFQELGAHLQVLKNDQCSLAQIQQLRPQAIIISPGPGTPEQAGICLAAIRHFGAKLPILGVCLGHQCIVQAFGGKIGRAAKVMHGKTSGIVHTGTGVFRGIPSPFRAARYHSLVAHSAQLPEQLQVSAWTEHEGTTEIMAVKHAQYAVEGVQFHPEAILSQYGHQIFANFLSQI